MNAPIPPLGLNPMPQTPGQVRMKPTPVSSAYIAKKIVSQSAPRLLAIGVLLTLLVWLLLFLLGAVAARPLDWGFFGLLVPILAALYMGLVAYLLHTRVKTMLKPQEGHLFRYAFDPGFAYSYSTFGVSNQFSYAVIVKATSDNECITLTLSGGQRTFLPHSSFESPADLQTALTYLRQAGKLK